MAAEASGVLYQSVIAATCDPILDQIAICRPIDDVAPSRKVMCFVNRMRVKVWVRIFGENHPLVSGHDGTIGSG
jgi:hypothetical protein